MLVPILLNVWKLCFTNEAPERFGNFKVGGWVILSLKYADEHVLVQNKETVVHDMTEWLIETGMCYGMKMKVENNYGYEILFICVNLFY
jgi:hypothetical protein